ncbi:MAG: hypothetical protein J6B91_09055 [Prevotella sp.]|nr:hypothetical protein [Prevotella sp.]
MNFHPKITQTFGGNGQNTAKTFGGNRQNAAKTFGGKGFLGSICHAKETINIMEQTLYPHIF